VRNVLCYRAFPEDIIDEASAIDAGVANISRMFCSEGSEQEYGNIDE
jgi:hypothetical protein